MNFREQVKAVMSIDPKSHDNGVCDLPAAIESFLKKNNWIASCTRCGSGKYETFSKQEHLVEAYPEFASLVSFHTSLGQQDPFRPTNKLCSYCENQRQA